MLLILGILIFAVLAFTKYLLSVTRHGSEIARRLLPWDLTFTLLLTLVIVLEKPWGALPVFACTIILWIAWLAHRLRGPDKSTILLNWHQGTRSYWIINTVFFLAGIAMLIWGVARQPIQIDALSFGVLITSIPLLVYLRKEICLTEDGVETGGDYIRWAQVKSYQWSASENKVTHVFFKTSRRLPIINFVQLNLPVEKKQAVNEIVMQKVPQASAAQEETAQAQ
jgi:hypothetical protein